MGFDFIVIAPPPPVSLWLLLCLWTWGIFFVRSSVLPSIIIQQLVVIPVLSQEGVSIHHYTLPSWSNLHLHLIICTLISSFQAKWNCLIFNNIHLQKAKLWVCDLVHQNREAKDCMDLKNSKMEKKVMVHVTCYRLSLKPKEVQLLVQVHKTSQGKTKTKREVSQFPAPFLHHYTTLPLEY